MGHLDRSPNPLRSRARAARLGVAVGLITALGACSGDDAAEPATPTATILTTTSGAAASDEPTADASTSTTGPASDPEGETRTYEVVSGDTLSAIADRFGVGLDELIAANDLPDPNDLSVGQEITVPAAAAEADEGG